MVRGYRTAGALNDGSSSGVIVVGHTTSYVFDEEACQTDTMSNSIKGSVLLSPDSNDEECSRTLDTLMLRCGGRRRHGTRVGGGGKEVVTE